MTLLVGMFFTMLACLEVGFRTGRGQGASSEGLSALDGAVFGLMGLLVAFTFSGAASRFEARRSLIVEETNDIGTAWLRLDLLAPPDQAVLRPAFKAYVEARLKIYASVTDEVAVRAAILESTRLQGEIWRGAVAAGPRAAPHASMLLLPALNSMFDITTTRLASTRMHPPPVIYLLLVLVFMLCSLLGGYSMAGRARRSWLHILCFITILTVTFYTIMDLEYPRRGLVQVRDFDQLLIDVRKSMDSP